MQPREVAPTSSPAASSAPRPESSRTPWTRSDARSTTASSPTCAGSSRRLGPVEELTETVSERVRSQHLHNAEGQVGATAAPVTSWSVTSSPATAGRGRNGACRATWRPAGRRTCRRPASLSPPRRRPRQPSDREAVRGHGGRRRDQLVRRRLNAVYNVLGLRSPLPPTTYRRGVPDDPRAFTKAAAETCCSRLGDERAERGTSCG